MRALCDRIKVAGTSGSAAGVRTNESDSNSDNTVCTNHIREEGRGASGMTGISVELTSTQ